MGLAGLSETVASIDDGVEVTVPQVVAHLLDPSLAFVLVGEGCIGHWGDILGGVKPIDDLYGFGIVCLNQVPNPFRPVAQENQLVSQLGLTLTAGGP